MGMLSFFTRRHVSVVDAFNKAANAAVAKGKFSASELSKLVSTVKNSSASIGYGEFKLIHNKGQELQALLSAQMSSQQAAKSNTKDAKLECLNKALETVEMKLSQEAIEFRKNEWRGWVRNSLEVVKNDISILKEKIDEAKKTLSGEFNEVSRYKEAQHLYAHKESFPELNFDKYGKPFFGEVKSDGAMNTYSPVLLVGPKDSTKLSDSLHLRLVNYMATYHEMASEAVAEVNLKQAS